MAPIVGETEETTPARDRRMFITLLIIVVTVTVGCVAHRMYRQDNVVEYPAYSLAFVEFDDRGEPWSPQQFYELQALIREANQSEVGAVVVLFVHGWNHDASPQNEAKGSLAGFKETLERISATVQTTIPGKPVLGIYFGWRGKSMRGPFKFFTFFTRQRAAARVAGTSATAMLGQVILDAKENPNSRMIVIGHSFGGQIVEQLLQQGVAASVLHIQDGPIHATADLTVLLNPASPATNAKQVIDLLRWQMIDLERISEDGRRWEAPLLVSFTSAGDVATRAAYPVGNLFGLFTSRFREYGPEFCSPITHQRDFYTRTAGHMPVLHSHRVRTSPLQPGQPVYAATADGFVIAGEDVSVEVRRRRGAYNDTPYWIMRVPETVMADHNDTWNPNLRALVGAMLTATGALEPDTELRIVKNLGMDPVLLWPRESESLWVVDRTRRIYAVADAYAEAVLVGCMPEGIDLANVIGHTGDSVNLLIVQWRPKRRGSSDRATEVVDIRLAPAGFRTAGRTVLQSDAHFLRAAADCPRQRLYLATRDQLYAADYGHGAAQPELVGPLPLVGEPTAMAVDGERQRLLVLDSGAGRVLEFDLLNPSPIPRVVTTDLESPSAMAIDPERGHLYVVESRSRSIVRWRRSDTGFHDREIVARHEGFRDPTFLQITIDGSVWVGDAGTDKVFLFSTSGELIRVLD